MVITFSSEIKTCVPIQMEWCIEIIIMGTSDSQLQSIRAKQVKVSPKYFSEMHFHSFVSEI